MEQNKTVKLMDILNRVSDYIIRIIMVNILVIFFSLPIITIIPAFKAGFKIFSDYTLKNEEPILRTYFETFIKSFKKSFIISIGFVVIFVVTFYNNRIYNELILTQKNVLYNIGYYITMVIIIAVIMIALYLPVVLVERDEFSILDTIKLAFYLSGKYFVRTILLTLTILIPYLMFATKFTIMLFVFMGISLPILIQSYILKSVRIYIKGIMVNEKND